MGDVTHIYNLEDEVKKTLHLITDLCGEEDRMVDGTKMILILFSSLELLLDFSKHNGDDEALGLFIMNTNKLLKKISKHKN